MRHAIAEADAAGDRSAEPIDSTPAARVEALLDWLEANRYLCAERFVESRVHARSARFGNLRIRQELGQHQVALSPDAARALEADEFQRACAVRARKFSRPPASPAERARQARFLGGRGFSPDVIALALREAGRPSGYRDESCDESGDESRDGTRGESCDDPGIVSN